MISGIMCEDCGKIMFWNSFKRHKKSGSCQRVQARNKRNNIINDKKNDSIYRQDQCQEKYIN